VKLLTLILLSFHNYCHCHRKMLR